MKLSLFIPALALAVWTVTGAIAAAPAGSTPSGANSGSPPQQDSGTQAPDGSADHDRADSPSPPSPPPPPPPPPPENASGYGADSASDHDAPAAKDAAPGREPTN